MVSCIMPTSNRRAFIGQAVTYFKRQNYPCKELIIVDDGNVAISDLLPGDPQIRYLRTPQKQSLGAKRNLACEHARGSMILHWDDDDWMAPWRIGYQLQGLIETGADICGLHRLLFYDPFNRRAWHYLYPRKETALLAGGSLCYRKKLWEEQPFPEIDLGEDTGFIWNGRPKKLTALENNAFYVALIHPGNTNPRHTARQRWSAFSLKRMEQMLGSDLAFYQSMAQHRSAARQSASALLTPTQTCD